MILMTSMVEIFTDGACKGNPGPGGWGALLRYGSDKKELCGGENGTTNNRMELLAAIKSLEVLSRPCKVKLTTDSEYVRKGVLEWMENWKKRQWLTSAKQPVKNKELWQRLDRILVCQEVSWHWVKGHSGHPGNERADQLANLGVQKLIKEGSKCVK